MERLILAAALALVAAAVAYVIQRRSPDAPTRTGYSVPQQVARADFTRPDAPWLVAVFTSATCASCAGTWAKAQHLRCDDVAVQELEATRDKAIHDRYAIEAVPTVVVADDEGVVRASFLGAPTVTDLWATVAELREPGSVPEGCDHGQPPG